jgi:hypothetical protein
MTKKELTNDQMIKNLIKDCDMIDFMILRERLVKIAEITLADLKKDPKAYDNPIFNHTYYEHLSNMILLHCGFEKRKVKTSKQFGMHAQGDNPNGEEQIHF